MKNWNWKQWTAFGVIIALVIAAVVCHLVQPAVSYAVLEMVAGGTFFLGGLVTYLFNKKTTVQINS